MVLLIRHALVDACGVFLAGRTPHIRLNEAGLRQAEQLRTALRRVRLEAIYCSPMERAQQTAAIIAGKRIRVATVEALNEVDFGDWTGETFEALNGRPDWVMFNRSRLTYPIPGGERMSDVQVRACSALTRICREHPGGTVAIVSHGDVLRALVAKIIGVPLDRLDAFEIDPASISALDRAGQGFVLAQLNCHANGSHYVAPHG